jgi:hypothetical protein
VIKTVTIEVPAGTRVVLKSDRQLNRKDMMKLKQLAKKDPQMRSRNPARYIATDVVEVIFGEDPPSPKLPRTARPVEVSTHSTLWYGR